MAFFLALIGSNFTHRSPVYSVLGAVSVTLCAGLCVAFYRVSARAFIGALCGLATLGVGFVGLGAHWASMRRADMIANMITYRFLPVVAVIALVVGLVQLQWRVAIHTAVICVGPLAAGLSSLTPNIPHVQLAATFTLIACASALLNLYIGPRIRVLPLVLFSLALCIVIVVMVYAIAVTLGYSHLWPGTLLAWLYIIAALAGFIGGLSFPGSSAPEAHSDELEAQPVDPAQP